MKVRWTKNSVRFRITPSELAAIERGEPVSETLCIAGDEVWRATIISDTDATSCTFESGELRIYLSQIDRKQLAQADRQGVYFQRDGKLALRYFIEKDFPCAHPRAGEAMEAPSETFAPPPGFEERKTL